MIARVMSRYIAQPTAITTTAAIGTPFQLAISSARSSSVTHWAPRCQHPQWASWGASRERPWPASPRRRATTVPWPCRSRAVAVPLSVTGEFDTAQSAGRAFRTRPRGVPDNPPAAILAQPPRPREVSSGFAWAGRHSCIKRHTSARSHSSRYPVKPPRRVGNDPDSSWPQIGGKSRSGPEGASIR